MNNGHVTREEFLRLSGYVEKNFGIHLGENKISMIEQRLRPLLISGGHGTLGSFLHRVEHDASGVHVTELLNRITTNHTYFNRESEHFRFLEEVAIPEHVRLVGKGNRMLRMWCAAASRGHEPYTLAMIQREVLKQNFDSWDAGLLATDISEQALRCAIRGTYTEEELHPLPKRFRSYFRAISDDEFEVLPEVRQAVTFRTFNLHSEIYPFRRDFDFVFCRNVLIYFEAATKLDVVRKIAMKLRIGGYLFVGLSESLGREVHGLNCVQPGVYKKVKPI